MDDKELILQAQHIIDEAKSPVGTLAQATEFCRVYAGADSTFYKDLLTTRKKVETYWIPESVGILTAFIGYVANGLLGGKSIKRQAEIDVLSDIMAQARALLDSQGFHPAAAIIVAGCALEEFLRNWVEEQGLTIGNAKPGIDAYSGALREKKLISGANTNEIRAWARRRNDAAHGKWDELRSRETAEFMIEGIALFMRQHGAS